MEELAVKRRDEEKSNAITLVRRKTYKDNEGKHTKTSDTKYYKHLKQCRIESTPRVLPILRGKVEEI